MFKSPPQSPPRSGVRSSSSSANVSEVGLAFEAKYRVDGGICALSGTAHYIAFAEAGKGVIRVVRTEGASLSGFEPTEFQIPVEGDVLQISFSRDERWFAYCGDSVVGVASLDQKGGSVHFHPNAVAAMAWHDDAVCDEDLPPHLFFADVAHRIHRFAVQQDKPAVLLQEETPVLGLQCHLGLLVYHTSVGVKLYDIAAHRAVPVGRNRRGGGTLGTACIGARQTTICVSRQSGRLWIADRTGAVLSSTSFPSPTESAVVSIDGSDTSGPEPQHTLMGVLLPCHDISMICSVRGNQITFLDTQNTTTPFAATLQHNGRNVDLTECCISGGAVFVVFGDTIFRGQLPISAITTPTTPTPTPTPTTPNKQITMTSLGRSPGNDTSSISSKSIAERCSNGDDDSVCGSLQEGSSLAGSVGAGSQGGGWEWFKSKVLSSSQRSRHSSAHQPPPTTSSFGSAPPSAPNSPEAFGAMTPPKQRREKKKTTIGIASACVEAQIEKASLSTLFDDSDEKPKEKRQESYGHARTFQYANIFEPPESVLILGRAAPRGDRRSVHHDNPKKIPGCTLTATEQSDGAVFSGRRYSASEVSAEGAPTPVVVDVIGDVDEERRATRPRDGVQPNGAFRVCIARPEGNVINIDDVVMAEGEERFSAAQQRYISSELDVCLLDARYSARRGWWKGRVGSCQKEEQASGIETDSEDDVFTDEDVSEDLEGSRGGEVETKGQCAGCAAHKWMQAYTDQCVRDTATSQHVADEATPRLFGWKNIAEAIDTATGLQQSWRTAMNGPDTVEKVEDAMSFQKVKRCIYANSMAAFAQLDEPCKCAENVVGLEKERCRSARLNAVRLLSRAFDVNAKDEAGTPRGLAEHTLHATLRQKSAEPLMLEVNGITTPVVFAAADDVEFFTKGTEARRVTYVGDRWEAASDGLVHTPRTPRTGTPRGEKGGKKQNLKKREAADSVDCSGPEATTVPPLPWLCFNPFICNTGVLYETCTRLSMQTSPVVPKEAAALTRRRVEKPIRMALDLHAVGVSGLAVLRAVVGALLVKLRDATASDDVLLARNAELGTQEAGGHLHHVLSLLGSLSHFDRLFFPGLFTAPAVLHGAGVLVSIATGTETHATLVGGRLQMQMGKGEGGDVHQVQVMSTNPSFVLGFLPYVLVCQGAASATYTLLASNRNEALSKKWPYVLEAVLFLVEDVLCVKVHSGVAYDMGLGQEGGVTEARTEDLIFHLLGIRVNLATEGSAHRLELQKVVHNISTVVSSALPQDERVGIRELWRRSFDSLFKSFVFLYSSLFRLHGINIGDMGDNPGAQRLSNADTIACYKSAFHIELVRTLAAAVKPNEPSEETAGERHFQVADNLLDETLVLLLCASSSARADPGLVHLTLSRGIAIIARPSPLAPLSSFLASLVRQPHVYTYKQAVVLTTLRQASGSAAVKRLLIHFLSANMDTYPKSGYAKLLLQEIIEVGRRDDMEALLRRYTGPALTGEGCCSAALCISLDLVDGSQSCADVVPPYEVVKCVARLTSPASAFRLMERYADHPGWLVPGAGCGRALSSISTALRALQARRQCTEDAERAIEHASASSLDSLPPIARVSLQEECNARNQRILQDCDIAVRMDSRALLSSTTPNHWAACVSAEAACPCCLQPLAMGLSLALPCGHAFHQACLHNVECTVCNASAIGAITRAKQCSSPVGIVKIANRESVVPAQVAPTLLILL